MIPQRWIEAYLRFLLRYRIAVSLVVTLITAFFVISLGHLRLHTDFFDFYPKQRTASDAWHECRADGGGVGNCLYTAIFDPGPNHYISFYNQFRRMFGSANIMSVIVEVKHGDIYNPATLQKIDRVTKYLINTKGVVPYQILSIAHPKVKSITAVQGAIQARELYYPNIPQTQEDADRVRFAVYANRGIRGVFVSQDDTAAVVHAGFWEEALDFRYLYDRMMDLKHTEDDANHTIYITGFPWLYTSVLQYANQIFAVFAFTLLTLAFLLYSYFRTWTGIWVPVFSGVLSSIWGLGIAALLGFNLDPLVLVIPIFLTARALSHSVQSMDRYHEEYYRLRDRHEAIVVSYTHLFAPAMSGIVTDGIGLLIVAVAPIPLIQKVAIFAAFWIVSIFISVVTLHPIILSYINPPSQPHVFEEKRAPMNIWLARVAVGIVIAAALSLHYTGISAQIVAALNLTGILSAAMVTFLVTTPALMWYWLTYCERAYTSWTRWVVASTDGNRRWVVLAISIALFIMLPMWGWTLKVGDMTPGAALLFQNHPYNVAYNKLNEKFIGASQLIVIADTMKPDGIKNNGPLNAIEEYADHMEGAEGAGGALTVVDIAKQLERLQHDGDPKWGLVPVSPKEIGQIFYAFTQNAAAGDLDRFMDPSGRYGSIITFFHEHSHDIIMNAINWGKKFSDSYTAGDVEFRYAGGLFGILAAVNEAVENSYWTNLIAIFVMVATCLYLTYGSLYATAILMIPVVLSQLAAEAFMVLMHIDMNVNSLPIAAAGAGVGVDYGIYHFSRMIDAFDEVGSLDEAVDYATATTGKAIIFTGTTMIAGSGFFWLSDLKFLSEMGLLLTLLMTFNKFGALIVVPALVKILRPAFLLNRRPKSKMAVPEPRAAVAAS